MKRACKRCTIAIVMVFALGGCTFFSGNVPLETMKDEGTIQSGNTTGWTAQGPAMAVTQRILRDVIMQSLEFEMISTSVLDLDCPLVEMVAPSIALVVFNLRPSVADRLRIGSTTACPFAMFHVDVWGWEILSATRATPSPEKRQLHVQDLLTRQRYTLDVPSEVTEAFQRGEEEFEARRGKMISVEPKRPCDSSLEEPYEYCYDVWVPAYFIEPKHTWCRGMCSPAPFETWSCIGCLGACDLLYMVWGTGKRNASGSIRAIGKTEHRVSSVSEGRALA